MNRRRRAVRWAALLGLPLSALSATAPTVGDLAHCAAIDAPDARLACYDTLAGRAVAARAPVAPAAPIPVVPLAPTPAPPAAPAAAPVSGAKNFGLAPAQVHAAPEGPTTIQANVTKILGNRFGRATVVLDNGQAWTIIDSDVDAQLSPGDSVTIKRALLGSFMMITPAKHSVHVRRTQ